MKVPLKPSGSSRQQKIVEKMFDEVDEDGSGEIDFHEFVEVMTHTMEQQTHEENEEASEKQEKPLPFPMMAMAYRRRKLMEATTVGTDEVNLQTSTRHTCMLSCGSPFIDSWRSLTNV